MSTRPRFLDNYNKNIGSANPTFNTDGYKFQNKSPVLSEKVEIDYGKYKEQM